MAIITPTIDALEIPTPPPVPDAIAPVVYASYGMLVQDYIDGRIQDFAAYYTPIATIRADLELLRDGMFRKYHRARREMLKAEGAKNATMMPGHLQRKLMDMALDEKREISEAAAKITAKYVEESLNSIYEGAGIAVKSDGQRSEMHYKAQAMSFESAKAALMAAYEHAKLRIQAFESVLKAIGTEFKLVEIEYKALAQAVEEEISAVKIQIMAAESIGDAEELQKIQAELLVAQEQINEALSRLPLIQAEIDKAQAEMGVMNAERALATFKELTAQASMDKSQARQGEIAVTQAKINLEMAKVGLQKQEDSTRTAEALSEIAARMSEEKISTARSQLQVVETDADATLTGVRASTAQAEMASEAAKGSYYLSRAVALATKYAARASSRSSQLTNRVSSEKTQISSSAASDTNVIQTEASNTVTALDASTAVLRASLQGDVSLAQTSNRAMTTAADTARNVKLATEKATATAEINALKQDLNAKVAVNTSGMMAVYGNQSSIINAHKSMLVGNAMQALIDATNTVNMLTADYNTWRGAHDAAVQTECDAIVEAAKAAADSEVTTKLYKSKGTAP